MNIGQVISIFGDNPYIQAGVTVILSFLLAQIASWLFRRVFGRLARLTRRDLDDQLVAILPRPIFYSVLLAGLGTAISLVRPPEPFDEILPGVIKSVTVLIWLFVGLRVSVVLLNWMSRHPERFRFVQPATRPLFDIVAKLFVLGAAAYFLMISWNINLTGWLASAGVVGIVLGLAAKDTVANLFAGVFILADAPYKVGDYIVLDGEERGRVTQIGIRSTRILTRDDVEITIPNSIIANSRIVNETGGPYAKIRVRIPVGVAYGSDIDRLREVLLASAQAALEAKLITSDPEPRTRFRGFGDSALLFDLLCWIDDPVLRGRAQDFLNTAIYKNLAKAGIEIPFPKRDLYVKELPEAKKDLAFTGE